MPFIRFERERVQVESENLSENQSQRNVDKNQYALKMNTTAKTASRIEFEFECNMEQKKVSSTGSDQMRNERECVCSCVFCLLPMSFPAWSSMLIRILEKMSIFSIWIFRLTAAFHIVRIFSVCVCVCALVDERHQRFALVVDRHMRNRNEIWMDMQKKSPSIRFWAIWWMLMLKTNRKNERAKKKNRTQKSEKCNYIFQFDVRPFPIHSFLVRPPPVLSLN